EAEKQRLLQLDALAAALQDVPIDRQRTAAPRDTPDQHYRKHSELHLRFLTCVATLANDNQDGLVVFPLQVSGLSYTIDSSQPGLGERESGADYQRVTIQLAGVRQPAPKATIDVPAL
ncbi:MAG TPA: hypothetical protein PKC18_16870, partial [Lacipirellulaceae bacterium]|nr:hypothetical protein [Lacipirellulaceae bacterium]